MGSEQNARNRAFLLNEASAGLLAVEVAQQAAQGTPWKSESIFLRELALAALRGAPLPTVTGRLVTRLRASPASPPELAEVCGVSVAVVHEFLHWIAQIEDLAIKAGPSGSTVWFYPPKAA